MSNAAIVGPVRSEARAVSVKLVAAVLRLRSAKRATPFTAATVVPPASTPPVGLLPSATLMAPVKLGTVLPNASWALTWTAGLMATPAAVVLGWTVKASRVAPAGVMLNAALVAPGRPAAVALSV